MLEEKLLEEWKNKLREEVFFWTGIEIKNKNQGTFISIVRYFKGDVNKIPNIQTGLIDKGEFANRNLIEQLMKSSAETILVDASDDIIDSIVLEDGELHKWIKDLFVDAYFRMEFMRITNTTIIYDQFEKILDVGEEDIVGGGEAEVFLDLIDKDEHKCENTTQ